MSHHNHNFHELKHERGEVILLHGHSEVEIKLPFTPLWVWLYIKPQHHCGGHEHDTALWSVHRHMLTIAADIHGEFAEIEFFALGE